MLVIMWDSDVGIGVDGDNNGDNGGDGAVDGNDHLTFHHNDQDHDHGQVISNYEYLVRNPGQAA